jgi:hypothetical protein
MINLFRRWSKARYRRASLNNRRELMPLVVEALQALGGSASPVSVTKYIECHHRRQLGDAWQYELRLAACLLRKNGTMKEVHGARNKPWELR